VKSSLKKAKEDTRAMHSAARVARFFSVPHSKNGKNVPNNHELYKMTAEYTKWQKYSPKSHKI
jgi:hypothetical protein